MGSLLTTVLISFLAMNFDPVIRDSNSKKKKKKMGISLAKSYNKQEWREKVIDICARISSEKVMPKVFALIMVLLNSKLLY